MVMVVMMAVRVVVMAVRGGSDNGGDGSEGW